MNNEQIIKQLIQVEAWAEGLRKECMKTRKMLENVDSPASVKGNFNELVARLTAQRLTQTK